MVVVYDYVCEYMYVGKCDLHSLVAVHLGACCDMCNGFDNCTSFTYTKYHCYLKSCPPPTSTDNLPFIADFGSSSGYLAALD